MIYLLPRSGLGNRMRAIDSAISLGADLQTSVEIYWVPDAALACPFSMLFEPFNEPDVRVHDCNRRPLRFWYLQPHVYALLRHLNLSPNKFAAHDTQRMHAYPFHDKRDQDVLIASFARFYQRATDYSRFRPIKPLRETITQQTQLFDDNTIGVHIRRTDHKKAKARSPDALFIRAMEDAIQLHEGTMFYLATDSEDVKHMMSSRFGSRIITSPFEASRESVQGMQWALIELYTLAATSRILGSYGSSYSTIASEIGRIELTRVVAPT